MRISDLGEFGLIELIQQWTRTSIVHPEPAGTADYRLTVENGDDAAAGTFFGGPITEFYTTDTMVDGVHFTSHTTPWRDLGWKALASNISDIAAMGGAPAWALVTLGLPSDTPVADVAGIVRRYVRNLWRVRSSNHRWRYGELPSDFRNRRPDRHFQRTRRCSVRPPNPDTRWL